MTGLLHGKAVQQRRADFEGVCREHALGFPQLEQAHTCTHGNSPAMRVRSRYATRRRRHWLL
mgnify:CR=1 FL=1